MARTLTSEFKAELAWNWLDDTPGLNVVDNNQLKFNFGLENGQGANQADRVWHTTRTLGASASETLDLQDLVQNIFADQLSVYLTAVKGILVINDSTLHSLRIGNAALTPWTGPLGGTNPTHTVPPQGNYMASNKLAGWPVESSAKNLKIENLGTASVTYRIAIVGLGIPSSSSSSSSSGA